MNVLFVSEFGPGVVETMTEDYISALGNLHPEMRAWFLHGFLKRYVAGGTRPVRLLNAVYMYLALPLVLLTRRVDLMIVRTTPPGIQLWCAALGAVLDLPVGVWIMDYHPEIEVQALERRGGFGWVVKAVRRLDTYMLRRMKFAIVLDDAMERLVRTRAPDLPVVQHTTWNGRPAVIHAAAPPVRHNVATELRLVYAGNLGYSHPLRTLEMLLAECRALGHVRLFLVGVPVAGEERFRALADRTGVSLHALPRTSFDALGAIFHENDVDAGLVVLSDESAGLVSPSKFGAYLRFGIATIYIGPPHTSSESVCVAHDAGFAIRNDATHEELRAMALRMRDVQCMTRARENTLGAAQAFRSKSGTTLAAATRHLVFGKSTSP